MKKRNGLTNLFYVIILLSLVGFLAVEFGFFNLEAQVQKILATALLALAIIMVACIEFVLPIASNKEMLKNKKYGIMVAVKAVLFVAAATVLFLYEPFGVIRNMTVSLVLFVVFYFIQFFISLDPKVERKEETEKPKAKKEKPKAEEDDAGDIGIDENDDIDDMIATVEQAESGTEEENGNGNNATIEDFLFDIESDDGNN